MLYSVLESAPAFSTFLHNGGYSVDDRQFKLFTFSPLKGNYSIQDKTISFTDKVSFEIRSSEPCVIQNLICGFNNISAINIAHNNLTVENCVLKSKRIYKHRVRVKTVSPIVVYVTRNNTERIYFSPEDADFNHMVVNNAKRKWLSAGNKERDFRLAVSLITDVPLKKEVTKYKGSYITAWHGAFVLDGNPEVLDFIYNTGLGSKNSQGFGMFELIE